MTPYRKYRTTEACPRWVAGTVNNGGGTIIHAREHEAAAAVTAGHLIALDENGNEIPVVDPEAE